MNYIRKAQKSSILIVSALLCTLFLAPTCLATEDAELASPEESTSASTSEKATITPETCAPIGFIATENWSSTKCYTGNFFLAGASVNDRSSVGGLNFITSDVLQTSGKYNYGFYAGNTITISGTYSKDLFVAGNVIIIDQSAQISGDLYVAGNSVTVSTPVQNIYVASSSLKIDAPIAGNVYTGTGAIDLTDRASIGGTLKYASNATVSGLSASIQTEVYEDTVERKESTLSSKASSTLYTICSFSAVMLIMALCAPNFLAKIRLQKSQNDFSACALDALKGIAILIGTPLAAIFLLITMFGLPLAGVITALYVAGLILAIPVVGYYLGCLLVKDSLKPSKWREFTRGILGITVVELISLIPSLGSFCMFITLSWGLGILWQVLITCRKGQSK